MRLKYAKTARNLSKKQDKTAKLLCYDIVQHRNLCRLKSVWSLIWWSIITFITAEVNLDIVWLPLNKYCNVSIVCENLDKILQKLCFMGTILKRIIMSFWAFSPCKIGTLHLLAKLDEGSSGFSCEFSLTKYIN